MSEIHIHTLLLRDAATQTIANPGASHCWHRLKDYYLQVDNELVKKELVEYLLLQTPDEGVAGFLRSTWLASMLNDDTHLAAAVLRRLIRTGWLRFWCLPGPVYWAM